MQSRALHKFLCGIVIFLFLGSRVDLLAQEENRITLSMENAPLKKVFSAVQAQTEYRFVFTVEELKDAKLVSIAVIKADLPTVLKICFQDQPLNYSLEEKFIIVHRKDENKNTADFEILGQVINEKGEGLEKVSVIIKETNLGTQTDKDGRFMLKAISGKETLVFSCIGYARKEVPLNRQRDLIIQMSQSVNTLDETVVKGYYSTTQRLNTGNVSTVKSSTIDQQPISNPLAALEGQVAGLDISQATGTPGGNFTVLIRGQNSISSSNNPLYIIDGVPYGSGSLAANATSSSILDQASPFNYINPAEIERIEILKDADATAIYGSRGANGVILITTKRGHVGTTQLDVSMYTGAGRVTRMIPLLNTPQYLAMRREAFQNDLVVPDDNNAYDLRVWDTSRYVDWEKYLIGNTAHLSSVQATLSGGGINTQFMLGLGYNQQGTVFPGTRGDQRTSANFNITHSSSNQKFRALFSGSFLSDQNNLMQIDLTSTAIGLSPDAPPLYDSTGSLNWGTASAPFGNPLSLLERKYISAAENLIGNAALSYQMFRGFSVKINAGYTQTTLTENSNRPITALPPYYGINTANATFANNYIKTWILEPQVEYQQYFGFHHLSALIGSTFQQTLQQGQVLFGSGYTNDAMLDNIAGAATINVLHSDESQYRYNAFFARLNYDWKSKYVFNLTGRRDGSSRFGPGKQFANFGALGVGWIFSKEMFIRNAFPFISFGKIRGSYGLTGNDQIGDYQYLSTYIATPYPYEGGTGLFPAQLSNPQYGWETNRKTELAIEIGFLNDRILFTVSGYRNVSSNQLVGYSLPLITGFPSVIANLPATVLNYGTEWELHTMNLLAKNFSWSSSINLTIPRNELVSYPNLAGSPYANVYTVGKSLYTKKLYHSKGVDPQTGLYIFQDADHDGQISYPNDLIPDKQVAKTFYGGFQNSLTFKGWQLDFLFQFVKQTGYSYLANSYTSPGMISNQPSAVLNRWQKSGDQASVQKYTQDYGSDAYSQFLNDSYLGDNTIVDASFVRLKNISFSWSTPLIWNQKMHIQKARIYLQCQNLITITHYLGMDPENQTINYLPPLKVITGGIQITL